jgi:hypothetical protein
MHFWVILLRVKLGKHECELRNDSFLYFRFGSGIEHPSGHKILTQSKKWIMGMSNNSTVYRPLDGAENRILSLLFGMIESQRWDEFGHEIINKPAMIQSIGKTLSSSTQFNGMTMYVFQSGFIFAHDLSIAILIICVSWHLYHLLV